MADNPVIAIASACTLPSDDSARETLLNDLEETLDEHDVKPERVKVHDGHVYAQTNIHTLCPECGERLHIYEIRAGPENGADAQARCDCGWFGRAVYRLIDLEEKTESLREGSCVAEKDLNVIYTPYKGTDTSYL